MSHRKGLQVLLYFILLLFSATMLSAQPGENTGIAQSPLGNEVELGSVVVTANRNETNIRDVPASISVIDKKDIENAPYDKAEELMKSVPGVDVKYHYAVNTLAGVRPVNIRGVGGSGDRTLLLVDGIPQNNGNNGWFDFSQVGVDSIEQIEVIRGPYSALYGSSAMGGVINVITKKPREKFNGFIEAGYGSMNTWQVKAMANQRIGWFGYHLSGQYESTDGYIYHDPRQDYSMETEQQEHNYLGKLYFYLGTNTELMVGYDMLYSDQNRGTKYFEGVTDNRHLFATLKHNGQTVGLQATAYANFDEWDVDFPITGGAKKYTAVSYNEVVDMASYGGNIQADIRLASWNKLSLGADYRYNVLDHDYTYITDAARDQFSKGKQVALSGYFQDNLNFSKRFIIDMGTRFDWVKTYDGENRDTGATTPYSNEFSSNTLTSINPRIGALWHITRGGFGTTVKSSAGTGFKAPTLYELYTTIYRGTTKYECNPNLDPERIISWDFGISQNITERVKLSSTFYNSYISDYIGRKTVSPTYQLYENVSSVRIMGVETELRAYLFRHFSASAGYFYNKSEITEDRDNPDNEGNYVESTPTHVASAGLTYDNPDIISTHLMYRYTGKTYYDNENLYEIDGYHTLDFKIARTFFDRINLSFEVENIFDEQYILSPKTASTTYETVAPGRIMKGIVKVKF